ncbi:DNA primase large subunit [Nymphon striatum]|nr:DNA primase large subunit [Nymphon striatum]
MDFKKLRKKIRPSIESVNTIYNHAIQLYLCPPNVEITLEKFEEYAIERLKVLRIVETTGLKHPRNSEEYEQTLQNELKKQGLAHYLLRVNKNESSGEIDEDGFNARQRDHVSHYILRLSYCQSELLRKWFITQETDLFRFRYQRESGLSQQKFLKLNSFQYEPISQEEKRQFYQEILDSTYSIRFYASSLESEEFKLYKVPFTEVLDLISSRKVLVKSGFAYIPQPDLISVLINTFKTKLSHALSTTKRALPVLEEDERLLPIISGLSERYVGKDYGAEQSGDEITPSMVDDFSKKSFPLCMRILHETLRRDNHLKHGSRLQYSLFLKGIGMTLEGVLQMWKAEFIKTMDGDKNLFKHFICLFSPSFDKQYSYGLRHSFGKEGKRVNYTPYNCMRIITSNAPAAGDTHGCPFKHINKSLLEKRLKGYDIHDSDTQKIMEQVNQGNYQIACSQYFEVMHKSANAEIHIIHPNQYFTESRNVAAGKFTSDPKINVKTTRSVMYPNKMEGPDDSVFMEFGMSSKELDDLTNKAEEVEEVCTLKLKYARLLKENGALKTVISNVNALPNLNEMVLNLQDAVNTLTNSRFSLPESPLLQNCPPSTHCTSSETSSPYDSSECDDNQVTIYPGLVVMKAQKKLRDMRSDAKSYIYSLMAMLWSRDVLSTHSLTSKRSNAHKDKVPKPCLDPDMVKQLSDLVSKKFNVDERQIKIHIKAKLNNVEKCHNIRRQFNF